jgi:GNAT superfamily N-acetyltransferase
MPARRRIKYRVREAGLPDAAQIASNNMAMARETEALILDRRRALRGVRSALKDRGRARYFVIDRGGMVAAQLMITLEWSDWRNGDFWWIQSVYVLPALRGRGLFGALFRHVKTRAKREGACGLRLYVSRHNRRALTVYERLGMERSMYLVREMNLRA